MATPNDDFVNKDGTDESYNTIFGIIKLLFTWQMAVRISDAALTSLLVLIKKILVLISCQVRSQNLDALIEVFPTSLYKARKIAGVNRDDFDKYVVCPTCDETYNYEESFQIRGGKCNFLLH